MKLYLLHIFIRLNSSTNNLVYTKQYTELLYIVEFPFNFVFFIPLRNIEDNSSLAEVIIEEHDQLDQEDADFIQSILKHKTKEKVLLLLDGYDEYTPRTNKDIDRAIEKTVGKCFLILTSRPKEEKDFTQKIKKKMDGEVIIEGFNDINIQKCCSLFLETQDECEKFLQEIKKQSTKRSRGQFEGLYEFLKVPIMLLMLCVLYKESEDKSLPERKIETYDRIYELVMDRITLKPSNFGCESSEVPNIHSMLLTLGKFAWQALQGNVKQLLLDQVRLCR